VKTNQKGSVTRRVAAPGNSGTRRRRFAITLCSVPVPIYIERPRARQLARFSFFSTSHGDPRDENYRVHMGYFATRAEAQRWLKVLLHEYPDACVTETPVQAMDPSPVSSDVRPRSERVIEKPAERPH
jgi:hypothetical protein